jgi:catechol 2,3-dioxygenase-like lactoylglutathione lyase family enzyme
MDAAVSPRYSHRFCWILLPFWIDTEQPRGKTMQEKIVPMIHVSDVKATVDWYTSIGFKLVRKNEEDGKMNWALLLFGRSEVMFDSGGKPSTGDRREVDLYIHTDDVEHLRSHVNGRAQVVEDVHDTFYKMRELIIRDCNGFWITFGQPIQQ